MQPGDLEIVRREAMAEMQAGADILDVNVGVPSLDGVALLPRVVQVAMEAVDVPLCLVSHDPAALLAVLRVYRGKPIVNSVNGQQQSLAEILPSVSQDCAAVIGLTMDDESIPTAVERQGTIAHRIVDRAAALAIPPEDIIDTLALSVATDGQAAQATLEALRRVKA
jgi:5-methyltetrahydrofolate--homocysteine methyltransferase